MTARTPSSSCRTSRTAAPRTRTSRTSRSSSTGRRSRATRPARSYQAALDVVVDKVERQAIDFKEKPRVRARTGGGEEAPPQDRGRHADTTPERQIVKTKRFAIEPMFEEDAVAAMEELGPRLLRVRERRDRAGRGPLQAQGRRLRADRAGGRRAVHAEEAHGPLAAGVHRVKSTRSQALPVPCARTRLSPQGASGRRSARRTAPPGAPALGGTAPSRVDLLAGMNAVLGNAPLGGTGLELAA